MRSKRASVGDETPTLFQYGMMSMFIVVAVFFVFLYVVGNVQNDILNTKPSLDRDLLIARFVYSPDCFVKYDINIMRAYPFVIDWNKFTDENLDLCMQSKKGFKLSLIGENNYKIINSKNWDGKSDFSIEKDIIIDNDGFKKGTLRIEVQNEK